MEKGGVENTGIKERRKGVIGVTATDCHILHESVLQRCSHQP